MGIYHGRHVNPCPRCGGVVGTTFISISPMSFHRGCGDCGARDFTPEEVVQLGDNVAPGFADTFAEAIGARAHRSRKERVK